MTDMPKTITLLLEFGKDSDAEAVDEATTQLLTDLRDTDLIAPHKVRNLETVTGAKSIEEAVLGAIAGGVTAGTIPALFAFLTAWMQRRKRDAITIKLAYGDRIMELTYNPQQMSDTDIAVKVAQFKSLLED